MRRFSLIFAALLVAVQPIQAAVCVGFGQSSACGQTYGLTNPATDQTASINTLMMIPRSFSCVASSGKFYAVLAGNSSYVTSFVAVIATDNSGSPNSVVWQSSAITISAGDTTFSAREVPFSGISLTSGNTYWIGIRANTTDLQWRYTASSGTAKSTSISGTIPTDISGYTWSSSTAERGFYVTFD